MSLQELRFQPAANYDHALWLAAGESGIDGDYWDIFGHRHEVSSEARRILLRSLGWDISSFEAVENERRSRWERDLTSALPQTAVVSEHAKTVPLTLPAHEGSNICYEIRLEDGQVLAGSVDRAQLAGLRLVSFRNGTWLVFALPLPAEVPLGYHTLRVTVNGRATTESNLIVCPDRCYLPPHLASGGRTSGFNVALYGLRSERNWGVGDFTDLKALINWAHGEVGFSHIGLNPLHALHNRAPYNTSPYLPLSIYYKNHLYVDLENVPEWKESRCAQSLFSSPKLQAKLRTLRNVPFVEYTEISSIKKRFLKVLYREFRRSSRERRNEFRNYCVREGELLDKFTLYCALDEVLHKQDRARWTCKDWPPEYCTPDSDACRAFAQEHPRLIDFYKYIQFVIEEQLADAQRHAKSAGMSIGLYHDLAVATDSCGSDLWAHRDFYVHGARVGAPPDGFSPDGQDWGFPPPNKETHRATGYRLFRESIRKIVRQGGALRIDHVMRLYRLFWVPEGMPPYAGTYVRDYATDLMHVLALESVRSQNVIVGEDLGTVTDEMRDLFTRFGILSYRLFPFEKHYPEGRFKHSWEYPKQALVSSSTHDLPTMAGFWQNRDIEARREAGVLDDAAYRRALDERKQEKQRMLDLLRSENLLPEYYTRNAEAISTLDGDLHNAIVGFLARVPSMILLLNQEDFTKETEQQNVPGTTAQYPNWQRKMRIAVDQLDSPLATGYKQMFRHQLLNNGRV